MRLAFAIFSLSLVACSHFQGPGDFKTGAEYATESPTEGENPAPARTIASVPFDLEWPVNSVRITQYFQPPGNPASRLAG